jgi:hypothetical protein
VNRDDVKKILWLYRPDGRDADDPEIMEALALARLDPELAQWLESHLRRQAEVRRALRRISTPAGLREQILGQQQARCKIVHWQRAGYLLAAAAVVAVLIGLPFWIRPRPPGGLNFGIYQTQMAAIALRGYAMEVTTSDHVAIRRYLAQHQVPADYVLPAGLEQAEVTGCAIESWPGGTAAMVCFRTGQPLPAGAQSDLWLFVIDQTAVQGAPASSQPAITRINRLTMATWNQGGKLYLLGTTADEEVLRKFL